jgi:bifunctional non-homologous end joining protein LigD
VYEEKYDGWRMVAYKDGRNVRLVSRRGVDHTERFADIAAAVRRLPARTLILDGEVCVFDQSLVSHMHLLMDPPAEARVVTPPVFMAFDYLYTRGRDLRGWPLKDRRKRLEDEIDGSPILPARRFPDGGIGGVAGGARARVRGLGGEGRDGAIHGEHTVVVEGQGGREGRFLIGGIVAAPSGYRGLLLGTRVGRELRYVGTVEWGVSRK